MSQQSPLINITIIVWHETQTNNSTDSRQIKCLLFAKLATETNFKTSSIQLIPFN
jgi:hypothetical protein